MKETLKLVLRRTLAFVLDYLLICCYALILFGITTLLGVSELSVWQGQIVGFFSLTLPVFLYFYLMERYRQGSWGKKKMKITVRPVRPGEGMGIFTRNLLKFLPWEIAHAGVHWMVYYTFANIEVPAWVWLVLIFPQLLVIGYVISLFTLGGSSSLYDLVAKTKVVSNQK